MEILIDWLILVWLIVLVALCFLLHVVTHVSAILI